MRLRRQFPIAFALLTALALPLTAGPPVAQAADVALTRPSTVGAFNADDVARTIAEDCTKSAQQILAAVQGLGPRQQFTTVRHRGDFNADIPENSLSAFEESYLRCRPGVETDVRRTADDVLVMFHDTHVGKMLEPSYDPLTGQGPNAALSSLTFEQLQQKALVNIARQPQAGEKVPSLDEFLDHYRRVGGQSLLYLEIKNSSNDKAASQDEIMDAVEQVAAFDRAHPDLRIFDRVVFKFRMSAFPLYSDWSARVGRVPDLPRVPLSQVAVSRQIARDIVADRSIPGWDGSLGGRLEQAVESWAHTNATSDGVLSVEVTMKDSAGYFNLDTRGTDTSLPLPFRGVQYSSPRAGSPTNPGTMAHATQIVRSAGKPLGQFVPIPDWVMFRAPGTFSWDQRLPNIDSGRSTTPITPREGYFNNNSACCYALRDRIDTASDKDDDVEQNDQRILLPWLEDIGATFLTADDTDSVDAYFAGRGKKLDAGDNRRTPNRPDPAMNSLIEPGAHQLPSLLKFVNVEIDPGGTELSWYAHGSVQVSEHVRTAADRTVQVNSQYGPVDLMAVYGTATLRVDIGWSSLDDPGQLHDRTVTSWPIPENMADGVHVWPMRLGSRTVNVRATVSRQWATIDIDRVVIQRTDRSFMWGNICASLGEVPRENRCNPNDRAGVMLAEVHSWAPRPIAPGDTVPMRTTRFTGPRPLAITTSLWGVGALDVPLSQDTVRLDTKLWGTETTVSLPGDHGEAVVHYQLLADGFRRPPP